MAIYRLKYEEMKKTKSLEEKWPDDDRSPQFIHSQVKHLESFCKNEKKNDITINQDNIRRKNPVKTVKLQSFYSNDYLFNAINNTSKLPYNYPSHVNLKRKITEYDQKMLPRPLSTNIVSNVRDTSKRLKNLVRYGAHEDEPIEYHFTTVKDSVTIRRFKKFLKNQGYDDFTLFEESHDDFGTVQNKPGQGPRVNPLKFSKLALYYKD